MESRTVYDPVHDIDMSGTTNFFEGDCARPIKETAEPKFVLPSLFSKTRWVHRHLSDAELLSILDAPVQGTKRINEIEKINLREQADLLEKVAPLKVLQEATGIFFDWAPPIERPHTILIYDVNRFGLKLEGLEFIYEEIN